MSLHKVFREVSEAAFLVATFGLAVWSWYHINKEDPKLNRKQAADE